MSAGGDPSPKRKRTKPEEPTSQRYALVVNAKDPAEIDMYAVPLTSGNVAMLVQCLLDSDTRVNAGHVTLDHGWDGLPTWWQLQVEVAEEDEETGALYKDKDKLIEEFSEWVDDSSCPDNLLEFNLENAPPTTDIVLWVTVSEE